MRERVFLRLTGKCRFLAFVVLALFLSGCQAAPTGPQPLTDADKEQITAVRGALAKAALAGDASAYAALHTEDAILLPAKGEGEMVRGMAEIEKRATSTLESRKRVQGTWDVFWPVPRNSY